MSRSRAACTAELGRLLKRGEVVPAVDRAHPLDEVAVAIRQLLDGRVRGKLVATV
jgi:NADPH:quinone reductase-like Zn-dependent oxidoreductase